MNPQESTTGIDELLLPFLHADEEEAGQVLAGLISAHVEPLVNAIVSYRLRVFLGQSGGSRQSQDAEDVCGEVLVRLLKRLGALRSDPDRRPISNLRGYVKVISNNCCFEYLRGNYPLRSALQDRLRYVLTHRDGLALWRGKNEERLCGFAAWLSQRHSHRSERLHELRTKPKSLSTPALANEDLQRTNLPDLLTAIFSWIGGPFLFDDLVDVVAELQGIKDREASGRRERLVESSQGNEWEIRDAAADVEAEVMQRLQLQRLWQEIRQLPPRQRFALLMNLKDTQGRDLTSLLPVTGVCTFREIAGVLEMTVERLAEVSNTLPLDDATIAVQLGITRQQVINLRKSARERLARRMKGF